MPSWSGKGRTTRKTMCDMNICKVSQGKATAEVWELHLCLGCCRMICLNHEPYKQVWLAKEQVFIYSHLLCPPAKPHEGVTRWNSST